MAFTKLFACSIAHAARSALTRLCRAAPRESKGHAFSLDVLQEAGIGVGLRVVPLVFPNGQGLDVEPCVQQHVVRDVYHFEFGVHEVTANASQ